MNFERFGEVLPDPLQLLQPLPIYGHPPRRQINCFLAALQVLQYCVSFLPVTSQLSPRIQLDEATAPGHFFRDIFPNALHNRFTVR